MSCLGVHFALSEEQANAVWSAYERGVDADVLAEVDRIEEAWDETHLQESDKAWDAIHRCLSGGSLRAGVGEWPLVGAVLGGECLYFQDDYIVRFLAADEVKEVAAALSNVTHEWFCQQFAALKQTDYAGTADARDLEYTLNWFGSLQQFFAKTAAEGRAVMFTADQ